MFNLQTKTNFKYNIRQTLEGLFKIFFYSRNLLRITYSKVPDMAYQKLKID